jgi:phosphohistidine phosphatase
MRLYVMRHGPAEDTSASGRDEDRELTPSGRDRVRAVATLLQREGELPGRILSSRLERAHATAHIVAATAKAAGWEGAIETVRELTPGGRSLDFARSLLKGGAFAPMIVGHEPDLSALVEHLLEARLPLPMDKAMVVALELHQGAPATLRFVVEPRATVIVNDRRG